MVKRGCFGISKSDENLAMETDKNGIITLIKKNIRVIDPTAEIILFGSRARGDEGKESDWDILILTDYPVTFKVEQKFRHHLFELELEVGQAFSTFVYAKADWNHKHAVTPFYQNVLKEGVWL